MAAGHTSPDLDYGATTALVLNGGSIRDTASNDAILTLPSPGAAGSLGANQAIVIDAVAPAVTNVASSAADGTYGVGAVIALQVTFGKPVTVTGMPQLTLETGTADAAVNYTSGSGTSSLTFTYTVAAGHTSAHLDYVSTAALALNGGTILDGAGNAAALTLAAPGAPGSLGANNAVVIDTAVPTVTNVTSSTGNGAYGIGAVISVQVTFSQKMIVTGTPQLTLETGAADAVVNYTSGSGGSTLTFLYTVAAGHASADLDYVSSAALALNGGTIVDGAGNPASLTLPPPGAAGSLGANKALVIDGTAPTVVDVTSSTPDGLYGVGAAISVQVVFSKAVTVSGTPQLTLATGVTNAVVNYASGTGTSTLTFTYVVALGHSALELDYVSTMALALNGGTIVDGAGNPASLTLAPPGAPGSLGAAKDLVISTTQADLGVTKTNGVTGVTAGGATTYTIVVTNLGPNAVVGATVADAAPAGMTFGSWTCVAATGSACPATGAGDVSAMVDLLVGGTATFTVPAAISTTATGSLTNTVLVGPPAGTTDPASANNSAADTDPVSAPHGLAADLSVTKTNNVTSVTSGSTTTYTVVVANAGPDAAPAATVTDSAAAGLAKTAVTCSAAGGAACPGSVTVPLLEGGLSIPTLPAGGSVTLTVTATVTAGSGSVTNAVSVAPPSGVLDPALANNTATDTDTVTTGPASADLAVTITNGTTAVTAGATTVYAVVVTNGGPAAADSAVITVPFAVGLTKTAVSCVAAAGAACPPSLSTTSLESGAIIPTLPAAGTVTLTVTAAVTASGGSVSNTATVAAPAGVTDPAPGNNSAADTDAVVVATATADLIVTISNGTTTVTSGGTTTYTIVVVNNGPAAVPSAVLTSPASPGLQKITGTCTASGGATCPTGGSVAALESGLQVPAMPAGSRLLLTVTASVTATSGTVALSVSVITSAGVTDPTPDNDRATDTDAIAAAAAVADLRVTKSNGGSELLPGQSTSYTIVVSNAGPAAVLGATVTDAPLGGLSLGAWSCTASVGASCPAAGSGSLSAPVNLTPGATATFTVAATVDLTASGTITNRVTVTPPPGVSDPAQDNNTASDTDTVPEQKVGVETRAGTPEAVAPNTFEIPYTVVVGNRGSIALTNLQVTAALSTAFAGNPVITVPRGVAAAGDTCQVNPGFSGLGPARSPGTNLLVGTGALAPRQECTLTLVVRVAYASAAAIPREPQVNHVEAWTSAAPGGARLASDTAQATVVLRLPRVDVTKALVAVQQVGEEPAFDVSYALVVRNTGEVQARNVQLSDDLAAAFGAGRPIITLVSGPGLAAGTAAITLAVGPDAFDGVARTALFAGSDSLSPGVERAVELTVRLRYPSVRDIPEGVDLVNTAVATTSADPGGVVISSDASTDVTESGADPTADDTPRPTVVRFVPKPRLALQKTASTRAVEVGDTLSYAVRVTNLGGPRLPETTVIDRLPLGFRYLPGSARIAAGSSAAAQAIEPAGAPGPELRFAVPPQAASDEITLVYRVRVGPGAQQGSGVNIAEAVTVGASAVRSNQGRAAVIISGGVFTTDACVVGKIFVDVNRNRVQDDDEPGIPSVRLAFEDGTLLVSDVEGKYSFCGLTPSTHVLKVDRATLPSGARLAVSGSRNAGDGGSLFVDLKNGEVHRTDFIAEALHPAVLAQIAERRARGEVWAPVFEAVQPGTLGGRGRPAYQPVPVPAVEGHGPAAAGDGVASREDVVIGMSVPVSGGFAYAPPAVRSRADTAALPDGRPALLDEGSGTFGVLRLSADRVEAPADGRAVVALTVRAVDAEGARCRLPLVGTIEVTGGQIQGTVRDGDDYPPGRPPRRRR